MDSDPNNLSVIAIPVSGYLNSAGSAYSSVWFSYFTWDKVCRTHHNIYLHSYTTLSESSIEHKGGRTILHLQSEIAQFISCRYAIRNERKLEPCQAPSSPCNFSSATPDASSFASAFVFPLPSPFLSPPTTDIKRSVRCSGNIMTNRHTKAFCSPDQMILRTATRFYP